MTRRVRELWQSGTYAGLVVFELKALQYCPPEALRQTVVNIEDPQSVRLAKMALLPVFTNKERVMMAVECALQFRYESKTLRRVGRVLLLSERDAAAFARLHRLSNVSSVPYGVSIPGDDEVPSFSSRHADRIVISGNMFHPPNVDGVLFFLRKVFPLVLAECPGARLDLVGARPDPRVIAASTRFGNHVVVTGEVPNISDYVRLARVSVCSVRLGIGVQTKILEALAWGTPVVTTPEGNSGIAGSSGTHLWVERQPAAMARRIVDLINGVDWLHISQGGLQHTRAHFTWDISVAAFERHIRAVVAQ